MSAQPPPPPSVPQPPYGYGHGYPPPILYDPSELYWPGQDDEPGYLQKVGHDNPAAITGFSFSISALGLLVLSGGLSFVVSLPCAIIGIVVGRRGVKICDADPLARHRNYARAGFIVGIVTTVLAALAALLFILVAIFPDALGENSTSGGAIGIALRLMGRVAGL